MTGELTYRPKDRAVWWVKYRRGGKAYYESSGSVRKKDAIDMLRRLEGKIVDGVPITPKVGRLTFDDAAADLLTDYRTNGKRSLVVVERRVKKHLSPYFAGRRLADITTIDVRAYIAARQRQGVIHHRTGERIGDVSNAEINREIALLKRMYSLAIQAAQLFHRPHIPMLTERNTRTGFFEAGQISAVLGNLPSSLRAVIGFAYITGWRIASEVLPLEWRQIDFAANEVSLDPETTKNRKGRTFPMTADLRRLLQAQRAEHERLQKAGHIVPHVFFREVAEGRGGEKKPQRIVSFKKAWQTACRKAGCPGRIPHDLRRTAIRNLVRAGIPERVAMMMAGHETRSVFERYNIVSGGDLKDAAQRLDAATVNRR